jgi:glycine cleavage system H protein
MTEGKIPDGLRYTKSHEWVRSEGATLRLGITDHAQSELTDIVFVDLPPVGKSVAAGQPVLTIESVKTVADVYAPVDGEVASVNEELRKHPDLVNRDPYGGGWLFTWTPKAGSSPSGLLSASEYRAHLQSG